MDHQHALSCEETFRRLDDYLDRELSADEMRQVREHIDLCDICAGTVQFEQDVIDAVRAKLRRLDAPAGLHRRISEALDRATEDLSQP